MVAGRRRRYGSGLLIRAPSHRDPQLKVTNLRSLAGTAARILDDPDELVADRAVKAGIARASSGSVLQIPDSTTRTSASPAASGVGRSTSAVAPSPTRSARIPAVYHAARSRTTVLRGARRADKQPDALGHINNTVPAVWFASARDPLFRIFTPGLDIGQWRLIVALDSRTTAPAPA